MKKRQEIGRGLRLAVNQEGKRIQGFDINTLTIMGNESYKVFAKNVQKEFEEEGGMKFGIIEKDSFANITYKKFEELRYLEQNNSEQIYNYLKEKEYIDNYVLYDSNNEESFARRFEANNSVKFYVKLPNWFKIYTPLGSYNQDWAVMIDKNGEEKLYFVIESKGNILTEELRPKESNKIACAKKHFKAIDTNIEFKETDSFEKLIEGI